jgi:hypothetical protein
MRRSLSHVLWLMCVGTFFVSTALANPLMTIDLASDQAWSLTVDDGPKRAIKVTAGGWNSDQQEPQIPSASAKDHVVYERVIVIPKEARGNAVKIAFGGCNYGAEVWLGQEKITEHHAPMTPFDADLTGRVEPGRSYLLRVKAYTRWHYGRPPNVTVGFDFNRGVSPFAKFDGHTKYAYGLIGYVRLVVLPPVHIRDIFVRTRVENQQLEYDVWITNGSPECHTVRLISSLSPWQGRTFDYPDLPKREATINAGQTHKVTVKSIPWDLGPKSYWWPNIPFQDDYQATLHWLELSLEKDGQLLDQHRQRFGFVEYGEGPYFYTVNGVRFTSIGDSNSYGQVGEHDCWSETSCFLPPDDNHKGCPETWKRYQRIGFNSMRLSTSVPTRYMLETADEAGFMLVPEGGSWGNGVCRFDQERFGLQLQEMIQVCRNHPSVARYSMANESFVGDGGPWRWLIDAAMEVDPTRPYVFEVNPGRGTGIVQGMKTGHAYRMQHYDEIVQGGDFIRGMGECCWSVDGMATFGLVAREFRLKDWAHFAPWSWINFWPNFLEGMNHERHPWKHDNHADRRDGVDGWGSPVVDYVRRSLHPYLAVDGENLQAGFGEGNTRTYQHRLTYLPGELIQRCIVVFHGGLDRKPLQLRWSARWDGPDGLVVAPWKTCGPFKVEPGFHARETIAFVAPELKPEETERSICLTLETVVDGQVVFHEDAMGIRISRARWQWVDDGHAAVSYSDGWKTWRGNPCYDKTEHYADTPNASVKFTFRGTKARFFGCKRNDLGIAEVLVDGNTMGVIDLYQSSGEYTRLFETRDLPPGQHWIEVRVTGRKNEASRGHYVIVDAFQFLPTIPPINNLNSP